MSAAWPGEIVEDKPAVPQGWRGNVEDAIQELGMSPDEAAAYVATQGGSAGSVESADSAFPGEVVEDVPPAAFPGEVVEDVPPAAEEAPIIISALRSPKAGEPLKSEIINPTETYSGFSEEIPADTKRYSALSEADKAEYESFFKDPAHPPDPALLRQWYHQKTGGLFGNADEVVNVFKKTGKFSTNENVVTPATNAGYDTAFFEHLANGAAADYGPEVAAAFNTLGIGGNGPNIWNADDRSLYTLWANNADLLHARLEDEQTDHPIASVLGELTGVGVATPVLAAGGTAAGLGRLGTEARALTQGVGEGALYGSGAAGPGDRLQGAGIGAASVPLVSVALRAPAAGYRAVVKGGPDLAHRIVAKAIREDGNTPAEVGRALSDAYANDVPMAIADTGENARGLLAAAGRSSGPTRTLTRDILEARQTGLADRVTNAIERDLGPVANPHAISEELMARARTNAKPLYEEFYGQAPAKSAALDRLMARPSVQKALNNAYRLAKEEEFSPETLGLRMGEDGNVILEAGPALSMEESIKANPSRFQSVEAPDEMQELRVRTYRLKNGRSFSMRGPLDMTQWLRLHGGIKDQGGSLSHIGLTNKARRLPTGSNENFLGRLVDDENGMDLDEAARALWEDGYFHDFQTRPTADDLIERLADEDKGTARYFNPADAEEIDNFERALDSKNSMLGSEVDERPFAEDFSRRAGPDDNPARGAPVSEGRKPETEKLYPPQTLDYIKRGLDDVVESYRDKTTGKLVLDTEGRAVNNTLHAFKGAVDELFPMYKAAREAYSGPAKSLGAMNAGRKALNMTADDLEARMRDMAPHEKEMFALGARSAMAEMIASKGDTANIINAVVGTGKKRAMLARLFGDRKSFGRFVQTLGQEKEGFRTFARALTGSPTALNLEDDATLKFAASAAAFAVAGFHPVAAIREAIKFGVGKVGDKTKQQVAALLSETDRSRFEELALKLREEAVRRGLLREKTVTVTNALGKGFVASQAGQEGQ